MNRKKFAIVPFSLLERLSNTTDDADHLCAAEEAENLMAKPAELPLTPDLKFILSRPNFGCQPTAQVLRRLGRDIAESGADEQAATIHWMLNHYLRDPLNWRKNSLDEFNSAS